MPKTLTSLRLITELVSEKVHMNTTVLCIACAPELAHKIISKKEHHKLHKLSHSPNFGYVSHFSSQDWSLDINSVPYWHNFGTQEGLL